MKLSVIVPVYNMASDHRLTWCLESLVRQRACPEGSGAAALGEASGGGIAGERAAAAQDSAARAEGGIAGDAVKLLEDYEILAVDDCSTDGSWGILQAYAARYPGRVRVFRGDRNRHQGGAKNQALAHARGEWIAFIDADDWVVPDYFARLLHRAQETGADCVGTDYCIVQEHTMTPGPVVANSRPEQAGIVDEVRRRSLLVDFGSLCVKIYRREIVYGNQDDRMLAGGTESAPTAAAPSAVPPPAALSVGACSDSGAGQGPAAPENGKTDPGKRGAKFPAEDAVRCDVFPEDIFYEDNAVVKTWVMRIRHFEYVPGPLYYYYQHEDSTVHTVSLRRLEDRKVSGRLMLEEAARRGYLAQYRPEIEYSYTVLFYKNTLFGAMQSLRGEEVRKAGGGGPCAKRKPGSGGESTNAIGDSAEKRQIGSGTDAAGVRTYRSVYDFVTDLSREMKHTFPEFQANLYYQARTDAEEKKLIALQMRSPRRFYVYYRLLWLYRKVRYGRV